MPKVTRVRPDRVVYLQGDQEWKLLDIDAQVHVWVRANKKFCLWADFTDNISIPLAVGTDLNATYHFEQGIRGIRIVCMENGKIPFGFAWRCLQDGTRYRDISDPIPYQAIVPLDNASDTMENRMLRLLDTALAARGLARAPARGHNYAESDTEFGEGYEYDEDADREIEEAATAAVAKRFAPGVQPSGNDDIDESTRGNGDVPGAHADKPAGEGNDLKGA